MQNDVNNFIDISSQKKNEKSITKAFFSTLFYLIVFGGVVYFFIFSFLSGIALGGGSNLSFYMVLIIGALILITIFVFIIRQFKSAYVLDNKGKFLFIFLIIFALASPFIAMITIRTILLLY